MRVIKIYSLHDDYEPWVFTSAGDAADALRDSLECLQFGEWSKPEITAGEMTQAEFDALPQV